MRYTPILVTFAVLIPSLAHAQKPQITDCRTLEAAGNYIGPNEVFVDGMVCRAIKTKATPSDTAPASRDSQSQSHMVLLGVMEPQAPRTESKPEATPAVTAPASGKASLSQSRMVLLGIIEPKTPSEAKPEATPADTAPASLGTVEPQVPPAEVQPEVSLGAIARAYLKTSQPRPAATPEVVAASPAPSVAVKPQANVAVAAPAAVTSPPSPVATAPVGLAVAQSAPLDPKPEAAPPIPAPTPATTPEMTTSEPQQGVKLGAFAAPETRPTEVIPEATPAPAAPASVAAVEPQPSAKPDVADVASRMPPSEVMPETHPAMPEPEVVTAEPQKEVILGMFKEPEAQAPEVKPDIEALLASSTPMDDLTNVPREGCAKNVSVGSMGQGKLILATPEWVAVWLERNQKKFPGVCFSDSPMSGVQNYLIVFSTSAPEPSAIDPVKITAASAKQAAPVPGMGTFTTGQGSTWHYTYDKNVTPTVTTIWAHDAPHNLLTSILYATAYSEQGIPVSQHWPGQTTKRAQKGREEPDKSGLDRSASPAANHMMNDLLIDLVGDIAKH